MQFSKDEEHKIRKHLGLKPASKNKQQNEAKWVNEWSAIDHPDCLQWTRVRLGPWATKDQARIYMTTLKWCDHIFVKDGVVHIVEAKLRKLSEAVGQLEMYAKLFPETPMFSEYRNLPIRMILLAPREDADVQEMCRIKGIEYLVFCPDWVRELLTKT